MNCQDIQPFVSALYDGESVPQEAAEHIGACPTCKGRLREYAEMGAELRLLACAMPGAEPTPLGELPTGGNRWARGLTARVFVPRFALGLGIIAIVGLTVGLAIMRAQGTGLWFQYNVSIPQAERPAGGITGVTGMGGLLHAGGQNGYAFLRNGEGSAKFVVEIKALQVQSDLVKLSVRARDFNPLPGSEEEKAVNIRGAWVPQVLDQIFAGTTDQEFDYMPGQKLVIPVEGGGSLTLSGKVYQIRPTVWGPAALKPGEIALRDGALVRGNEFLGKILGGARGQADNSAFGVCVPKLGALVFALKPFEGAVQGVAEYGEARFTIDGEEYTLFSATPITGGPQPREIWVCHAPNCPPSWPGPPRDPVMIGAGDVSNILDALRK